MNRIITWRCVAAGASVWAAVAAVVMADGPETNRFQGGSYDGWDMNESAAAIQFNGPAVTLSSGQQQIFDGASYSASAAALTITESSDGGNLGIKAGKTLTLAFVDPLVLKWDIAQLQAYGGTAAAKAGPATLANGDAYLRIPITGDFSAGQTLILTGLRIAGLPYCPQHRSGRIVLDFDEDSLWDTADEYTITVRMIWAGGAYDGWSANVNPEYQTVLNFKGSLLFLR